MCYFFSELEGDADTLSLFLFLSDNYQGEESDIVIATLTRSNPSHDIGFMYSPERLNVLLSRARNCLIMIGNADTFTGSRKGGELWTRLFKMLRTNGHIYEGLPVRCFRHPDRTVVVKDPKQFDVDCPDGGCQEPWLVFPRVPFATGEHLTLIEFDLVERS